ncbi:serrate RNA effector molecule homolog isoform X3 [Culicoides brevitarsis]|uniref:serrate RNA effector molecule homolog isoform X3 n=1 Tax=Culicoides brevitarsis TaxID=469753 RepID=UPI00307C06C5
MGDSDDEYDRKRRDKFRGERGGTESSYRSDRRSDERRSGGRDEWQDRPRGRQDYREYRPPRERAYSPPERSGPPMKRMRGDWEERPRYAPDPYGLYGYGHDPYAHAPAFGHMPPVAHPREAANPALAGDIQTQPAMMTLKQFLVTQDDSISDSDAIAKYNEYKLDFRRQQLNEFFVAHKDEEWFKIKYHPEESAKRKEEQVGYLKKRIEVFNELLEAGLITKAPVDMPQSEQLIRLLDTVVIKLEGGTEEDLKALDQKPPEVPKPQIEAPAAKTDASKADEKKEDGTNEEKTEAPAAEKQAKKRKRQRSESGSSSSGSSSSSDSSDSENEEEKSPESPKQVEQPENNGNDEKMEETETPAEPEAAPETENDAPKSPKEEGEDVEMAEKTPASPKSEKEDGEKDDGELDKTAVDEPEDKKPETIELDADVTKEPIRELHKTSSIFLRNLAPTVTKAEVEAMCKRYNGFLRVAIADPLVERRWFRRGWVTFQREVNIKEICWNLNNIRLRDCELGAIVNRDLSRRVRPVNGITVHRNIIRSDIKLAAKIAHNLDEKANLWKLEEGATENLKNGDTFGFQTRNPVLQNITDFIIEEGSAEEEELLGLSKDENKAAGGEGEMIERDDELIQVLDKIILYLRIVHSVDFYNHCEYPYEDEMPNRCGIIHARGPPPQNPVTQTEIQDYTRNFEQKMEQFLAKSVEVEEEELKRLGSKDADNEVEKFIKANSQELGKDKWLCPLSGKKFKGPDFIRKHIFNKHSEKVEEVRKEVEYYNNYLKDAKRPQLPENPANTKKAQEAPVHNAYRPPPYGMPGYMPPYGGYAPMMGGGRGRGGFRGSEFIVPPTVATPVDTRRKIVPYNDLDSLAFEDSFI